MNFLKNRSNEIHIRREPSVDIFQIQQPDYFLLEVKKITKIAVKWDC